MLSCAFISCSGQKEEPQIICVYKDMDRESPPTPSYTDKMEPQEIISHINSTNEEGGADENYITGDAICKIIQAIEQGGSNTRQAWKALEILAQSFDGEYGSYDAVMYFHLASSTILEKQWLALVEKYCGAPKPYEEIRDETISFYLRAQNDALNRIAYHQKTTDLPASEKAKRIENAQKSYQLSLAAYEKCLAAFHVKS